MPRINRIRLLNYAWANRRIDDLILDFHGGMNAEIRLGNGGGKSVLQRLIYQAVCPNTTVSNNRIEEYLKNRTGMTVIEWLPDDQANREKPEVFTTGVFLSRNDAAEDTNSSVSFFTFISKDDRHLSLDHLPNVVNEAGMIKIEAYTASMNRYRNLANNYSEIWYFNSSDRRRYQQMLEEFEVPVRSWKEVIFKMISTEDPFSAFLKETKTTDQLINKYLLPNIEQHLSGSSDNADGIRSLLTSNIENAAGEKENRELRDDLRSFLEEKQSCDSLLEGRIAAKKELNEAASRMKGFQYALNAETERLEAIRETIGSAIAETEETLRRIGQEEVSERYYRAEEAFSAAGETARRTAEQSAQAEQRLKDARHERNVLEAKRILDDLHACEGEYRALQAKLAGISETEQYVRLNSLSSALHMQFQKELEAADDQKAKTELIIKEKETALAELQNRLADVRKQLNELIARCGGLQERMKHYEAEEKALLETLNTGIALRRDLTGCLLEEDVNALRTCLKKRITDAETRIQNYEQGIEEAKRIETQKQEELEQITAASGKAQLSAEKLAESLKQYRSQKEVLTAHLMRYHIPDRFLFDRETLLREWKERRQENESRSDQLKYEIQQDEELHASAKSGNIYIPESILRKLNLSGIRYQTGEMWLMNQTAKDRKRYLADHPLLPYGLLMDKENYELLREMDLDGSLIRQIVPILRYPDLETKQSVSRTGGLLEVSGQKLLLQENESLLNEKERNAFLAGIEERIRNNRTALVRNAQEAATLSDFERAIRSFAYDSEYESKKQDEYDRQINEIAKLKQRKEDVRAAIDSARIQAEQCRIDKSKAENDSRIYSEQSVKFETWIKETEPGHRAASEEYRNALQQKKTCEQQEAQYLETVRQTENEQKETEAYLNSLNLRRSEVEKKLNRYHLFEGAVPAEGNTEELESEYRKLAAQADDDRTNLEQQLQASEEKKKSLQKRFELKNIEASEAENRSWSVEEEQRLDKLIAEREAEHAKAQEEKEAAGKQAAVAENEFEKEQSSLQKAELDAPLPKEEILLNFSARRQETRTKRAELEQQRSKNEAGLQTAKRILLAAGSLNLPADPGMIEITIEADMEGQYESLKTVCSEKETALRESGRQFQAAYMRIKDRYITKTSNALFQKVLSDSDVPWNDSASLDELEQYRETDKIRTGALMKKLDQLNKDLESLEKDLNQMINAVTGYTRSLIQGLRQIASQSNMHVEGKLTKVRLLRIELAEETSESAVRLEQYLRDGVNRLAEMIREKNGDPEKECDKLLNSRRLIDVFLKQERIPVKVYRFDENSSQSGPVDWERAARSNSGGEHSTSCFVIIAAMMAYIRGNDADLDSSRNIRYETLICDNPFASISSEYLVKPLIAVTDNLHMQLISFTHNTQQSIANSFDVVVQLRNTALRSGTGRIDVENERISEEKMEQASLFSGARQTSLF